MTPELYTVHFQDEAPAIGSGFRFVLAREGRKWVHLLDPYTLRGARLRLHLWRLLRPVRISNEAVLERVQAVLNRAVLRAEAPSAAAQAAITPNSNGEKS